MLCAKEEATEIPSIVFSRLDYSLDRPKRGATGAYVCTADLGN